MTRSDGWPWSCDSFVVLPTATTDGSMLLGKNSDRPVNETQPLRHLRFTWGNTASSAIFVLPSGERPPHFWWAAATPCTSVYVPVFVEAGALPEVLQRAGSARTTSVNPESAPEDAAAGDSYWWTFQRLLDAVKGDALGSAFADRQAQVRETFDELETAYHAELEDVLESNAGAKTRAALTRRCVDRALAAANGLLDRFGSAAPD